jgi:dienelactone hydrolase
MFRVLHTPTGVRFGLLGNKGPSPAPTLLVFSARMEDSLGNEAYIKAGRILAGRGYLCVSLDLPCHGEDAKAGEPEGLAGWRARLEKGEDLLGGFLARVSAVLDYLIQEGYTDPRKVAACGTSRGGFIAMHVAAADARVRCAAGFSPVTNLLALREFAGMEQHAATRALALTQAAPRLAGRPIWVMIGNNDRRVSTDDAIAFTRAVVAASVAQEQPARVELRVAPAPPHPTGHYTPTNAHEEAAAWIWARLEEDG